MLLNQTVISVGFGLLFIWSLILSVFFYKLFNHYRRLTRGVTKKDLKSVLDKLVKQLDQDTQKIDKLIAQVVDLKKDSLFSLQKVGLVRFNPFAETGGDQSFSLAALDAHGSGFVVSGLHSRETTRVYVKPVKTGKATGGYELSIEEKRAIKKAKKTKL